MALYDGKDRRKIDIDHDTLIVMVQLLKSHVENFDNHRESYQDHVKDDKIQFKAINDNLQKILNYKYMILGGFIVTQILMKYFWKF